MGWRLGTWSLRISGCLSEGLTAARMADEENAAGIPLIRPSGPPSPPEGRRARSS